MAQASFQQGVFTRPTHISRNGFAIMAITLDHVTPETLSLLTKHLRATGSVIFPTETFFGIGCDATNPVAVNAIYQVKGREATKPLPLIAADTVMVSRVCVTTGLPRSLLSFWPGPLTLLLKARAPFAGRLVDAHGRVAIRVSTHPAAALLSRLAGGPITATSANLCGCPPAAAASQLDPRLVSRTGLVLNLPPAPSGGLASTIASVHADGTMTLHREGAINRASLTARGLRILP